MSWKIHSHLRHVNKQPRFRQGSNTSWACAALSCLWLSCSGQCGEEGASVIYICILFLSCHVSSPSLPPSLPPSLARALSLSLSLSLSGTTSTVPHGEEARNRQAEAPYIVVYEFTLLFSIRLYKLYTEPEMLNNDIAKICPGDSKGASQKEHQRLHPGNGLCDNLLWQLTVTT